jgi:hypothetical protein
MIHRSDSARAVAAARAGAVVWNHGAAADDVQRLPGVVSVSSPASRYLVALARAVAALRPAATIALVTASGRFARFAREGLERADPPLGLGILARFSFRDLPAAIAAAGADAILACSVWSGSFDGLRCDTGAQSVGPGQGVDGARLLRNGSPFFWTGLPSSARRLTFVFCPRTGRRGRPCPA